MNISSSKSNVIENTKNDFDHPIQRIFVAKLTGSQEIPFVNKGTLKTFGINIMRLFH
jgi:hypothetical protein